MTEDTTEPTEDAPNGDDGRPADDESNAGDRSPTDRGAGPDQGPADDTVTAPEGAVETAPTGQAEGSGELADDDGRDLVTLVEWAAFGVLCLLALVATFRFYFATSNAIRIWFSRDFVPIFQAVFNLLVLVASGIGISVLVRRLT
jgi:hypothetical protein